jgi:hypothetical protein
VGGGGSLGRGRLGEAYRRDIPLRLESLYRGRTRPESSVARPERTHPHPHPHSHTCIPHERG